ncbi:MAG: hypothetical protein KDD66_02735 [Bdellovibrionales bacterium]|nr:hypothetical protein [Bdellovibrionales bacterium]
MSNFQSILLIVSFMLSLIAAWSIVVPFFSTEAEPVGVSSGDSALQDLKDRLFRELEELEFDFRSARISQDEYKDMKGRLSVSIAEVLGQLDSGAEDGGDEVS